MNTDEGGGEGRGEGVPVPAGTGGEAPIPPGSFSLEDVRALLQQDASREELLARVGQMAAQPATVPVEQPQADPVVSLQKAMEGQMAQIANMFAESQRVVMELQGEVARSKQDTKAMVAKALELQRLEKLKHDPCRGLAVKGQYVFEHDTIRDLLEGLEHIAEGKGLSDNVYKLFRVYAIKTYLVFVDKGERRVADQFVRAWEQDRSVNVDELQAEIQVWGKQTASAYERTGSDSRPSGGGGGRRNFRSGGRGQTNKATSKGAAGASGGGGIFNEKRSGRGAAGRRDPRARAVSLDQWVGSGTGLVPSQAASISAHAAAWTDAPRRVRSALQRGYRPVFFRNPRTPHTVTTEPEALRLLEQEVEEGKFIPADARAHHSLFTVVKGEGPARRLIHDLRDLNRAIRVPRFSLRPWRALRSLVQGPGWLGIKIDLTAAYRQVGLCQGAASWMGVLTPEGVSYIPTGLPFGLATAPAFFQKVASTFGRAVERAVHGEGLRVYGIVYLDDFLFLSPSRQALLCCVRWIRQLSEERGVLINWSKSELEPSSRLDWLGLVVDLAANTVSLAPERAERWARELRKQVRRGKWLQALRTLAGRVAFTAASGAQVLPHTRELYSLIRRRKREGDRIHAVASWWAARLQRGISSPVYTVGSVCVVTDATPSQAGALLYVGERILERVWHFSPPLPIAVAELRALLLALREWPELCRGKEVLWSVDSVSAKAARHNGGSPASTLMELAPCAVSVSELVESLECRVRATWVPSRGNAAADWLSRGLGWSTAPLVARMMSGQAGASGTEPVQLSPASLPRSAGGMPSWLSLPDGALDSAALEAGGQAGGGLGGGQVVARFGQTAGVPPVVVGLCRHCDWLKLDVPVDMVLSVDARVRGKSKSISQRWHRLHDAMSQQGATTVDRILEYLWSMLGKAKLAPSTIRTYANTIVGALVLDAADKARIYNAADEVREICAQSRAPDEPLAASTTAQVQYTVGQLLSSGKVEQRQVALAILIQFSTISRANEVIGVRKEDMVRSVEGWRLGFRLPKYALGTVHKLVPTRLWQYDLGAWIQKELESGHLFPAPGGGPVSYDTMLKRINEALRIHTGVKKLASHALRRGAALEALRVLPEAIVQALGAWRSRDSMQAYLAPARVGMSWLTVREVMEQEAAAERVRGVRGSGE
ncbi:hypothetical protein KIPB_009853 [Kipferlia bialata]|uniref:Reverse transcriptase domain-containing protein n=1 Tax=Kipferlia bialata TaxID=797122 RepID=A0A9K3D317_9EUKA|nr:hypothetical protein KIPB_009853 [Kipferlia bialata]|eukprot:g9853.t1